MREIDRNTRQGGDRQRESGGGAASLHAGTERTWQGRPRVLIARGRRHAPREAAFGGTLGTHSPRNSTVTRVRLAVELICKLLRGALHRLGSATRAGSGGNQGAGRASDRGVGAGHQHFQRPSRSALVRGRQGDNCLAPRRGLRPSVGGEGAMKLKRFLLRYYPPGIILEYEQQGEVRRRPSPAHCGLHAVCACAPPARRRERECLKARGVNVVACAVATKGGRSPHAHAGDRRRGPCQSGRPSGISDLRLSEASAAQARLQTVSAQPMAHAARDARSSSSTTASPATPSRSPQRCPPRPPPELGSDCACAGLAHSRDLLHLSLSGSKRSTRRR